MDFMSVIRQYWPFILPVLLLQLGLMVAAVADILRQNHYRVGSRGLWLVVAVLGQLPGPIAYFLFGRPHDA